MAKVTVPMTSNAAKQPHKTRIFLVDDHPLIRMSLRDVFASRPGFICCGEAADRQAALDAIPSAHPDLVIVDLKLKNSDGLDLVKDLASRYPKIISLVLSMHDEVMHSERVIRAGASGFVSKHEDVETLLGAVRHVLSGEIYWSPRAAAQVASRVARPTRSKGLPMEQLSERELQVFESVGSGTSTFQIAHALHIDVSTVETYRARIKEKLGLKNAAELLQEAIRWNVAQSARAAY